MNGFKIMVAALALAASTGLASAASYRFDHSGPSVATLERDGMSITARAADLHGPAKVAQTAKGLGVVGRHDSQPGQIDSFFGGESLRVDFAREVRLERFTLGRFGWNLFGGDDFDLYLDDARAGSFDLSHGASFEIGEMVRSFTIAARWDFAEDGLSADAFTLRSVDVAPVPVPAAGALLLAGLGALGWARRRA